MPTVRLRQETIDAVWIEALQRRIGPMANKRKTNNPARPKQEFIWDLGGAMVEAAVAQYMDTEWLGETGGKYYEMLPDVWPNIEARYASNQGPLRVREKDRRKPPSTPYVLGWIHDPFHNDEIELKGWLPLSDCFMYATTVERSQNVTYDIEVDRLYPMAELKRIINETSPTIPSN